MNPRPPAPKAGALPLRYSPVVLNEPRETYRTADRIDAKCLLRIFSNPRVEPEMDDRTQRPADERGDYEEPHLTESGTTDDQRRTEAAGRVHRRARDRDPDQVHRL